jgi:hypothetical protein
LFAPVLEQKLLLELLIQQTLTQKNKHKAKTSNSPTLSSYPSPKEKLKLPIDGNKIVKRSPCRTSWLHNQGCRASSRPPWIPEARTQASEEEVSEERRGDAETVGMDGDRD